MSDIHINDTELLSIKQKTVDLCEQRLSLNALAAVRSEMRKARIALEANPLSFPPENRTIPELLDWVLRAASETPEEMDRRKQFFLAAIFGPAAHD